VIQYRYILADETANLDTTTFISAHEVLSAFSVTNRWNMISLPVRPTDRLKSALFPTLTSNAFSYMGGYHAEDTLEHGPGYWLNFPSPKDVVIAGMAVTADSLTVYGGWNIIGSLTNPTPVSNISPYGTEIRSLFFGYENGGYRRVDSIQPGKACWVKVSTDGQLTRNGLITASNKNSSKDELSGLCRLLITDNEGNGQVLYFGSTDRVRGTFDVSRYELPPRPPHGMFDARYITNMMVELLGNRGSKEIPLQISSDGYPLLLRWESNDGDIQSNLKVGRKVFSMDGSGATRVSNPSEPLTLQLSLRSDIPHDFSLGQNYPNPFNSMTIVDYSLLEPSIVTLKVYNMLGQEVQLLADNEFQTAGFKHLRFDAENLSSGLYFYRLTVSIVTGSGKRFTQVRKMVLIR